MSETYYADYILIKDSSSDPPNYYIEQAIDKLGHYQRASWKVYDINWYNANDGIPSGWREMYPDYVAKGRYRITAWKPISWFVHYLPTGSSTWQLKEYTKEIVYFDTRKDYYFPGYNCDNTLKYKNDIFIGKIHHE